jgi:hypothetical protein
MKTQAETIADLGTRCAGPDQFQNFDSAFRRVLTVPKAAVLKDDAKWKRARARKRAKRSA